MFSLRRVAMVAALCLSTCIPVLAQEPQSTLPLSTPDTIMVIRVKSLNQSMQALTDTVASFNPMFVQSVQTGIDDMKQELQGVDFDGPAAILIFDPKKSSEPLGIFTLSDAALFEQKLNEGAITKAVGNIGFIANNQQIVDDAVAVFKANNLVAVPTGDMKDMIVMDANVSELITRFKPEIKAGFEKARGELQAPRPDGTAPALTEPQMMMLRAMTHFETLVDELERQGGPMQMGLSFSPQEALVNVDVNVAPGTPAAKFFADNNVPVNNVLAKYLPQDAYVSTINAFDPNSQARVMDGLVDVAADVFALDAAEAAAMHKTVAEFTSALTGLSGSAEVVHPDAQEAGVMLFGITGADAARKSFTSMMELTKSGKLGKLMGDYGVAVNFTERHRDSGGIPVDKMEVLVDFDKVAAAMNVPQDQLEMFKGKMAETMRKTYGTDNSVVMEIAYGKKLAAIVYGPELEKRMDAQVELIKTGVGGLGDLPEYQAAIANQSDKASGVMHLSLFRFNDVIAKMLAGGGGGEMMSMLPTQMMPTRAELPPNDQPMTFGVVFNENKMTAKFHMPMQPVRDYVAVVQRKFSQMMMQQMMQQPGRGPAPMPPQNFDGEELSDP